MKYQIKHYETTTILFMRKTGPYGPQNEELMQKVKQVLSDEGLMNSTLTIYGIARDNPQTTSPDACRYDVGFSSSCDLAKGLTEFSTACIDGGRYCEFEIPHTAEGVQTFWGAFNAILLSEHLTFDANRFILEKYDATLLAEGKCVMSVPIINS